MSRPYFSADDLLVAELCICGKRDFSRVNEHITLCTNCHLTVNMFIRCIERAEQPITDEIFWNSRMYDMHDVISRDTHLPKTRIVEVRTQHTINALVDFKMYKQTGLLDMFWESYVEYRKKHANQTNPT